MNHSLSRVTRARLVPEHPRRASSTPLLGSRGQERSGPLPDGDSPTSCLVCWYHPEWALRFPWLVQGTTGRSPGPSAGDFRLFHEDGARLKNDLWTELAAAHGFDGIRHARQVHGKKILPHDAPASGLEIGPDADGHLAGSPGVLMGVTVADCVPVFLVDPRRRSAALLHAGWRGTATGILEAGISLLSEAAGGVPEDILLHLGPAICGSCYEVGPEVHGALGLPAPEEAEPVDLRRVLEQRAMALGVLPSHITRSPFCTRCSGSPFFSHRGGDAKRQVGFLGIRPE